MMIPTSRGARASHRDARQSGFEKFLVVNIRALDGHGQGNAATIGEHRTLHAEFTAICGIFAGFFPRPAAPWS